MSETIIDITPEEITCESDFNKYGAMTIDEIYHNQFNVIIGRKKSYLLYHNGDLRGYCHSFDFGIDVIKSLMSRKVLPNHNYKLIIKQVDSMTKVYFYEVTEGYMYNSNSLLDKFRLVKMPKIELKYQELN